MSQTSVTDDFNMLFFNPSGCHASTPHYADFAPSTLATSATASGVQACCSGVQGTEQPSTRIPVAGLPALPQAHGLAILHSPPPAHDSGTVCQQMSVGPTSQSKLSDRS